jgi:site-specific recombinase XerD
VEVGKETDNEVKVHSFISDGKPAPKEIETSNGFHETCPAPDTPPPAANLTGQFNGQFADFWLEKMKMELYARKYSPSTRTSYIRYNKALWKWLEKPPEAVTNDDAKRYLAFLEQKQQSASTMNFNLSAFKFFFRCVLKRDTVREQKRPRLDIRVPSVFSKSEIKRILDCIKNPKHCIILMIAYDSGLRVGEVVKLRIENIDFDRKRIIIVCGKGRKSRETIMSDKMKEILTFYISQYEITGWLFPGADPLQHMSVRSAQYAFKKALKKAKIEKNATFHSLRHSFATHLLENGTGIFQIRDYMGHSSVRTTEVYTKVANLDGLKVTSPLDMIDQEDKGVNLKTASIFIPHSAFA